PKPSECVVGQAPDAQARPLVQCALMWIIRGSSPASTGSSNTISSSGTWLGKSDSLLSNENKPVFPVTANATPLLLDGFLNQPRTAAVMSIDRNLFRLETDTIMG